MCDIILYRIFQVLPNELKPSTLCTATIILVDKIIFSTNYYKTVFIFTDVNTKFNV